MMFQTLLPMMAARISMRGMLGNVMKRSVILIRTVSMGPRKYPETNPMAVPIATEKTLAKRPTMREILLPQISWL